MTILINLTNMIISSRVNTMEYFNASDVKREFGEVLLKAQHRPVGINKNGKPVAVMVSAREYAELQECRERQLRHDIEAGIADIKAGRIAKGEEVLGRMRKRIADAGL